MKVKGILKNLTVADAAFAFVNGDIVDLERLENGDFKYIGDDFTREYIFYSDQVDVIDADYSKDKHYNNDNGSLYLFAEQQGLNAWEFDIIKRIVRCRKKGHFIEDLEKTKRVIDLYLKEYEQRK